jgi:hypothetical protein
MKKVKDLKSIQKKAKTYSLNKSMHSSYKRSMNNSQEKQIGNDE